MIYLYQLIILHKKDCDNFINHYNNRNLYEIIKYE